MDEPTKVQDESTSEQTEETSEKTETFTKEEVAKAEKKGKSDGLAEMGRLRKTLDTALKTVTRLQDEEDERESESHKDQPEYEKNIKLRRTNRELESKLADRDSRVDELEAKTTEAQEAEAEHTKERNAREVATRLGVNAKTLVKFTDGSVEAMEDLAKSLPQKGEGKSLKVDSGKTLGGESIPTNMEQFKKWVASIPQEEYEKVAPEVNKMMRDGKIN